MKVLFVIAEGFRDEELFVPKEILETVADVHVASPNGGVLTGKLGRTIKSVPLVMFTQVDVDVVIFVGGPGAPALFDNKEAHAIAQRQCAAGRILAAICIAPVILGRAGVLTGIRCTVWDGDGKQSAELRQLGATVVPEDVVVDGHIVTANGPDAATAFGNTIKEMIL